MINITVLSLLIIIFVILSLVEPFNKKVRKWMRVARFYLGRLKATRHNLRKLPKTVRKIWPVLKKPRAFSLFKLKLLKNYHYHKQKPASD